MDDKKTNKAHASNVCLDYETIKSFSIVFETQPCPSCNKTNNLEKIDYLLMYCSKCDHVYGYDDTTNFYDHIYSIMDISPEEIMEEIKTGDATYEILCQKCNNSDPNFVLIQDGCDGKEAGLYCAKCDSKMDNAYEQIDDLPDQCVCDRDPSIISFSFDNEGQIIKAECTVCGRSVDVPAQDQKQNKSFEKGSYNGRVYVDTLDLVEPGSHIAWHKPLSYWHHAIVTRVFRNTNEIEVINYYGLHLPNKGKILKQIKKIDFKNHPQLYRIDYKDARYSNEEAISRAHSRLDEADYNIFINNCESFAHWCKMGVNYSQQFIDFFESLGPQVTVSAAQNFIKTAGKFAAGKFAASMPFLSKYALKALPVLRVGSTAAAVGYHIYDSCKDIKKANDDRKEGKIEKKEFVKVILKRVCKTLVVGCIVVILSCTGISGTLLGAILAIGAEVVASGVGCLAGRALTKLSELNK